MVAELVEPGRPVAREPRRRTKGRRPPRGVPAWERREPVPKVAAGCRRPVVWDLDPDGRLVAPTAGRGQRGRRTLRGLRGRRQPPALPRPPDRAEQRLGLSRSPAVIQRSRW